MVTELITFKIEHGFLNEVDTTVKNTNFQNRTEFIRSALRDKIEEIKLKQAMIDLAYLKGSAKKKVTEKEYEKVRKEVFKEFERNLK